MTTLSKEEILGKLAILREDIRGKELDVENQKANLKIAKEFLDTSVMELTKFIDELNSPQESLDLE